MKYFLQYNLDERFECDFIVKPKLEFGYNGRHSWKPIVIREIQENQLLDVRPISVIIERIDSEGVILETYTISKIERITKEDSNITIKFGYALINY